MHFFRMNAEIMEQTSCIILSAGSSVRAGSHKALLMFDAERTFIQKIAETYSLAGVEHVVVVINAELNQLIKERNLVLPEMALLVINENPELGRFNSLQTGIKHLKPGNYSFFQNIDNPFTSKTVLAALLQNKDLAEVIIPAFEGKSGHPVLLSPKVAESIAKSADNQQRIDEFLRNFHVKKVEVSDGSILANINSADDYRREGFRI